MNNQQLVAKILEIFKDSSLNDKQKTKILLELLEEKDNIDAFDQSINILKQFICNNIKTQNIQQEPSISIKNLYGIITDNNQFRIVEERSHWINEKFLMNILDYEIIQDNNYSNPWTNGELFYVNDNKAYAFPIKQLLSSYYQKNGLTTEAMLLSIIETVNEYLYENPTFVETLFEEKSKKLSYRK